MKLLLTFLMASSSIIEADLIKKEITSIYDQTDKRTIWFRDEVEIMTQIFQSDKHSTNIYITPLGITPLGTKTMQEGLRLSIKSGNVSNISDFELDECRFVLLDVSGDNKFDLLLISHKKKGEIIEAYSIVGNIVEPVPSAVLRIIEPPKPIRDEDEDSAIYTYIRSKIRESEQAAPSNR